MPDAPPSADTITRFILEPHNIRGEICTLNDSFQQAIAHQHLPKVANALLGDFCAAVCLLSGALKFEGTLTLQIRGDGPVPLAMAEATDQKALRCILKIREDIDPNSLNAMSFKELIGTAVLTLTVDPIKGKRYQGIVPLEGNDLAECLEYYFVQSEQLPTKIWLFGDERQTAGLMLQALPNTEVYEHDEDPWDTATMLANTATADELQSLDHETMLKRLFNEFTVRAFPAQSTTFACSCSEQRSAQALISIGETEAFELLAERGNIDIHCEFCNQHYRFDVQKLRQIFGKDEGQLH